MDYKVDLRDIKFQLFEWLDAEKLLEAERFADWDAENVEMVIDEGPEDRPGPDGAVQRRRRPGRRAVE